MAKEHVFYGGKLRLGVQRTSSTNVKMNISIKEHCNYFPLSIDEVKELIQVLTDSIKENGRD